jgi:hypothetical protein
MSSTFVGEHRAKGVCDRCGQTFKLKDLKFETVKQRRTSLRTCPSCYDKDHPQLMLGTFPINDPQALRNPRSDASQRVESRDVQWGWAPVGMPSSSWAPPSTLQATGQVGSVTVLVA